MNPNQNGNTPDKQSHWRKIVPLAFAAGALTAGYVVDKDSTPPEASPVPSAHQIDYNQPEIQPEIEQHTVIDLPKPISIEKIEVENVTEQAPDAQTYTDSIPTSVIERTTTTTQPVEQPVVRNESTTTTTTAAETTIPPETTVPPAPETTVPPVETAPPVDTIPHPVDVEEPVDTVPDEELLELAEPQPITAETGSLLAENTILIPGLGCSGYLVRDAAGEPTGAITAEHCSLRADTTVRKIDDQGVSYIQPFLPLTVYSGDQSDELSAIDTVSGVMVPKADDLKEDFAVLAFGNADPQEIFDSITPPPQLQLGDTAYVSGWPLDQDNVPATIRRRQEWPMIYIGEADIHTTLGEKQEGIQLFALKSNEDGAECSFGASGSVAISADGKPIGTLAIFDEFVPDTWQPTEQSAQLTREYYEQKLGVNLQGYTNICGFATKPAAEEMEILEVRGWAEDPDDSGGKGGDTTTTSPETENPLDAFRNKTFSEVFNPAVEKTFMDAWLQNPSQKGGPDTRPYIENPLIARDESGGVLLYWYDQSITGGFGSIYFANPEDIPASLDFYRQADDTPETAFVHPLGIVEVSEESGGYGLKDEAGSGFGAMVESLPGMLVTCDLVFENGQPYLRWVAEPGDTTTTTTTSTTTTTIPVTVPEQPVEPTTTTTTTSTP